MWANAQPDGRPAECRWCRVLNATKFGFHPLLDCRAVTLPIGKHKTWRMQSEFCTWQNSVTEQQPPKMYKGQTLCKVWLASIVRWCPDSDFFGDFLHPAFPASRVQYISDLHSKFALRPHQVWKYGRHPICDG